MDVNDIATGNDFLRQIGCNTPTGYWDFDENAKAHARDLVVKIMTYRGFESYDQYRHSGVVYHMGVLYEWHIEYYDQNNVPVNPAFVDEVRRVLRVSRHHPKVCV